MTKRLSDYVVASLPGFLVIGFWMVVINPEFSEWVTTATGWNDLFVNFLSFLLFSVLAVVTMYFVARWIRKK